MVDAADRRRALGGQAGEHQARRAAQIARHDRGADQMSDALDHYRGTLPEELRAHAGQLGDVHEPLGVDLLGDDAVAVGQAQQRHHLRLQVGREAGVGLRRDHHRLEHALGGDLDGAAERVLAGVEPVHVHAELLEPVDDREQVVVRVVLQRHVAVGDGGGHGIG